MLSLPSLVSVDKSCIDGFGSVYQRRVRANLGHPLLTLTGIVRLTATKFASITHTGYSV